jgi:hypothetical protein
LILLKEFLSGCIRLFLINFLNSFLKTNFIGLGMNEAIKPDGSYLEN